MNWEIGPRFIAPSLRHRRTAQSIEHSRAHVRVPLAFAHRLSRRGLTEIEPHDPSTRRRDPLDEVERLLELEPSGNRGASAGAERGIESVDVEAHVDLVRKLFDHLLDQRRPGLSRETPASEAPVVEELHPSCAFPDGLDFLLAVVPDPDLDEPRNGLQAQCTLYCRSVRGEETPGR